MQGPASASTARPANPQLRIRGLSEEGGLSEEPAISGPSAGADPLSDDPAARPNGNSSAVRAVRPILSPLHSRRLSESLWAVDPTDTAMQDDPEVNQLKYLDALVKAAAAAGDQSSSASDKPQDMT